MKVRSQYFIGFAAATCLALIVWCEFHSHGGKSHSKSVDGHPVDSFAHKKATVTGVESTSPSPSAKTQTPLALRQFWDDPAWRSAHLYETILKVEGKYGRLFSQLRDWSPERLEELKTRLAANMIAIERSASPYLASPGSGAEFDMGESIMRTMEENSVALREFMGNAEYAKLDAFEHTEPYRDMVSGITNSMRSNGVEINGDLEQSILEAYGASIRSAAEEASTTELRGLNSVQVAQLHDEQMHSFHTTLLRQMGSILNEHQIDVFMQSQLEQQENTDGAN